MKKVIVIGGGLLLLIIIISALSKNSDVKKSFEAGKNQVAQTPTPISKEAILSSKDKSIQNINIWMKPESSGTDNVTAGTVPNNTKVEVLDSKTVNGVVFYQIKSSVGKVDVLPTDFEARKKAMATKPQSEWTVVADPSFPVKGWVTADFVTNLK